MSHIEETRRQIIIAQKFRKGAELTFSEIQEKLEHESLYENDGYNYNICKRTFDRDRKDIYDIFGIAIEYDKSKKVYYLDDERDSKSNEYLFESYQVYNVLRLEENNRDHIFLDKRHTSGTEYLKELLHAIKKEWKISFDYRKFYTDFPEQKTVKPLALKMFRYRWYLIAVDSNEDRRYALDRISNVKILNERFEKPAIDIHEIHKHCFGVSVDKDYKPQKIVLSFTPVAGKYVKSLPWHDSQKILIDNDKELRISLYVYPTDDFKIELLSIGKDVKVLEPQSLADDIKQTYKDALKQYE